MRDCRLEVFGQLIDGPIHLIVQFISHAEQEIVRGFEFLALNSRDQLFFFHLFQRARPIFEKCHPVQVLKIAQPAAAVLDVGFLHGRRVAEFLVARRLVLQARGDIFFFVACHAFGQNCFLQFLEELCVSGNQPRLD